MRCEVAREALSARIDGEYEGVPSARVDAHLDECASCRAWYALAGRQSEALAGVGEQGAPDLTDTILAGTATSSPGFVGVRRHLRRNIIRIGLTGTGIAQIIIAMLQMTGTDFGMHGEHPTSAHLVNETTAWALALGVCMVVAAWWQRALPGLLVVLSVFTVVLIGYVIHDVAEGAVTLARVLSHLPVLAGLVFAAWGSVPPRPGSAPDDLDLDHWSARSSRGRPAA
ncbi:DUF2275 domain-containing protein [Gordonia sp. PKS22-38]|uniref:DUF2275 domain-containing protein n=1 Tax=Gordonia prachuapensis TaxID=3115651 RepID=A0ABU7MME5_9ACTN|nr:DUF2275 domain-containing protein [Gordonia sp. PKS22-38]